VLPSARLTREQITHSELMLPAKFPDHALDVYVPLDYEKYLAVAPGIVLVKAPGHTPGSQMVYVQMANASEFLFIGDVAWHLRNIETQRERPRLLTWVLLKEDRFAVFGQLATLYRLHQTQPDLHIVPGHDGAAIDRLVASGALKAGIELLRTSAMAGLFGLSLPRPARRVKDVTSSRLPRAYCPRLRCRIHAAIPPRHRAHRPTPPAKLTASRIYGSDADSDSFHGLNSGTRVFS